ncbi:hypothetical protein FQR65_LT01873 [Abscondita terminalis]|nr:hypothetical protein FQR65_LT01873 [Abscondita terminalis]
MLRISVLCLLFLGEALSVPLFAQQSCCGQPIQGCQDTCWNNIQFNPYNPYMQQGMQQPMMQPPVMQPPVMQPIFRPPYQQSQQQPYYQSVLCNPYCQGFSGCCEWQPYGQQSLFNPVGINPGCSKENVITTPTTSHQTIPSTTPCPTISTPPNRCPAVGSPSYNDCQNYKRIFPNPIACRDTSDCPKPFNTCCEDSCFGTKICKTYLKSFDE